MSSPVTPPLSALDDRRLEVDTPEQVAVGFDLAGPGSRFAAFLIDAVVLVSLVLAILFGTLLIATVTETGWRGSGSVFVALMVLLVFSVFYGYFVYFEGFRDGETPGKKRFGLRVVHDGGYPITVRAAAIRNLIRLVDVQPFPSSLIGGAFILFHPKAQRLGDMAAGTVVVRERPVRLLLDEDARAAGPPRLSEEQYSVLRQYIVRRDTLELAARRSVAAKLARHFRPFDEAGTRGDDALLIRVYDEESSRRSTVGAFVGTGSPAAAALVRRQRDRWRDYRSLVGRARERGLAVLSESDVSRFAALYREMAADLARLRTYGGSRELIYTLEHSVGAGHNLLYSVPRRSAVRAWRWLAVGFPALVRRRAAVVAASALVFFGPGLISGTAVLLDPGRARQVIPAELIARAEEGARRAAAGQGYVEVPPTAMPLMSSSIIANNVQVSFIAFAGGILAGAGTLFVLLLNGVFLGAVVGLFHAEGLGRYLWSFVLPHGVIELTAITIAGAAGLWLGSAFVLPGRMTRSQALIVRGREAISLIGGVVVLLLVAGVIEGFISPGPLPDAAKLGFGALTGVFLFTYLGFAGRTAPAAAPADPPVITAGLAV